MPWFRGCSAAAGVGTLYSVLVFISVLELKGFNFFEWLF